MTTALQSTEHTWRFDLENGGAYCSWCKQRQGSHAERCPEPRRTYTELHAEAKKSWKVSEYSAPCPKCGGKPLIDPDRSYHEEMRECSDCSYRTYVDVWPWKNETTIESV